ncbi:BrnT family toxin [Methyloprofundus sp.]|uniref:BrnT family toxin n=1 Tax=Methyloprofundus sp. TaxID=2020875 RepID=UPI003D0E0299
MEFTWDENKRLVNLQKHKIDFVGSEAIFDGYTVTFEDDRIGYDEQRFVSFGQFKK